MQTIRFSQRAKMITVWILLVLTLLFLWRVRQVALPFFWAMITAYLFLPLVRFLASRTRIPRVWWIVLLYLSGGALVYWGIVGLVPVVTRQYVDLAQSVPDIVANIQSFVREHSRVELYGFTLNLDTLGESIISILGDLARQVPEQALAGVGLVFETLTRLTIYAIATFYFLHSGDKWVQRTVALLPPHVQLELTPLFQRVHATMNAYIQGQLLRMLIMGTLIYVALLALQVRFALLLAILGGLLELVPILGPIVGGGLTALVALFQPEPAYGWSNLTLAIAVVILYTLLNQLEESFLIPNMLGYLMDLPPLLVLFAILAGGSLGGALGVVMAVPVAAIFKLVLRYLYAKLMDKPVIYEEFPSPKRRGRRKRKQREKEASS